MVDVQLVLGKNDSTVLTCVFVPRENVQAIESDVCLGNSIKRRQGDDPGDLDSLVDETDGIISVLRLDLAPACEVECLVLPVHGPGCPLVQEDECPPDRRHVNRKEGTVQDKDICIQHTHR